jgi:hypothetical protein
MLAYASAIVGWALAFLFVVMGFAATGIAMFELLPKAGYVLMLVVGLYLFSVGVIGFVSLASGASARIN